MAIAESYWPQADDGAMPQLAAGIEECRRITKKYGTSFYFATQFFPREMREGIYAIYAFARIPDEIVDDPNLTDADEATECVMMGLWYRRALARQP